MLSQSDPDFNSKLAELAAKFNTTAVFDGVGGDTLSKVAKSLPRGSSIYVYGFLGGDKPFCIPTAHILMNALNITGFGNFTSKTVQDPQRLEEALKDLALIIDMPHFKTKVGKRFTFEEIDEALRFSSQKGEKAVLLI